MAANEAEIKENTGRILDSEVQIAGNAEKIAENADKLDAQSGRISENEEQLSIQSGSIEANASEIEKLWAKVQEIIGQITSDKQEVENEITDLRGDMAQFSLTDNGDGTYSLDITDPTAE